MMTLEQKIGLLREEFVYRGKLCRTITEYTDNMVLFALIGHEDNEQIEINEKSSFGFQADDFEEALDGFINLLKRNQLIKTH